MRSALLRRAGCVNGGVAGCPPDRAIQGEDDHFFI
jgi:hypothetical protein